MITQFFDISKAQARQKVDLSTFFRKRMFLLNVGYVLFKKQSVKRPLTRILRNILEQ